VLDQLSLAGQRQFFADYWSRRDPDPTTRVNEYRIEMFRRYEYSNDHFSVSISDKDDGWKTDRGRVYMTYGEPDEITSYPYELEQEPFAIWDYYSLQDQGPRYFIFEDQTGYGDFELAHSNAKGERYDARWADMIERGDLPGSGFPGPIPVGNDPIDPE